MARFEGLAELSQQGKLAPIQKAEYERLLRAYPPDREARPAGPGDDS